MGALGIYDAVGTIDIILNLKSVYRKSHVTQCDRNMTAVRKDDRMASSRERQTSFDLGATTMESEEAGYTHGLGAASMESEADCTDVPHMSLNHWQNSIFPSGRPGQGRGQDRAWGRGRDSGPRLGPWPGPWPGGPWPA